MHNFTILSNIPVDLISEVSTYWKNNKDNLSAITHDPHILVNGEVKIKTIKDIHLTDEHLLQKIKSVLNIPHIGKVAFLITPANSGHGHLHVDNNRSAAINIPIEVDIYNSLFYIGNDYEHLIRSEWDKIHSGEIEIEYKPENYSFYNLRKPVLVNTKKPHSFANWADTDRVILTIDFYSSYEEVLSTIPKHLYV